jgi:hypothetical protein
VETWDKHRDQDDAKCADEPVDDDPHGGRIL